MCFLFSFPSKRWKRVDVFSLERVVEYDSKKPENSLSLPLSLPHTPPPPQHKITSLDVVVPKLEVVYESWGAAHDQGEDSGRRIFSVPDFIKEKGGITAGECYNFGGVFSEADPGFLVENFDAPS